MRILLVCLLSLSAISLSSLSAAEKSIDTDAEKRANDGHAEIEVLKAARQANLYYLNRKQALIKQLESDKDSEKVKALRDLSALREASLIVVVKPYLDFNLHSNQVVQAACLALAKLNAQSQIETLTKITQHQNSNDEIKQAAWNALAQLKQLKRVHFDDQSADLQTGIRATGITMLGTEQIGAAAPLLAKAVATDPRVHVRRMAAIGLGKIGDPDHAEALIKALADGDIHVRRYAANALVKMDHKKAIPYLLVQLESNVGGKWLNQSLIALSGQDFGYDHTGTLNERRKAIARGFSWYTDNSADF